MKKHTKIVGLIIFSLIVSSSLVLRQRDSYHIEIYDKNEYTVNPPTAKTGAPGETNCTVCHTGVTQSAFGIIDFSFSGLDQKYIPGQSYSISIGTSSGPKNGFEMVILDNSDNNAGSFNPGVNSSVQTGSSRKYIRHSASSGVNSWTFDWTAPSTEAGDLTVYFAFNKSNADG